MAAAVVQSQTRMHTYWDGTIWSHLLPMKLLLTDSDQMPACCTQSACSLSVPCAKASVSSNVGSSSGDAVLQGFSVVGVQATARPRRAGKGTSSFSTHLHVPISHHDVYPAYACSHFLAEMAHAALTAAGLQCRLGNTLKPDLRDWGTQRNEPEDALVCWLAPRDGLSPPLQVSYCVTWTSPPTEHLAKQWYTHLYATASQLN